MATETEKQKTQVVKARPTAVVGNEKFKALVDAIERDAPQGSRDKIESEVLAVLQTAIMESGQEFGLSKNIKRELDLMINAIQARINKQINAILHDPDFQALESAWRSLETFVINAGLQAGRMEVRVMDISKQELAEHVAMFPADEIRASPIYLSLYGKNLGAPGGTPISAIAADMYFGPSRQARSLEQLHDQVSRDVQTIEAMGKISADCNAPFLSSVTPKLFGDGYETWADMQKEPNDLTIYNHFKRAEYLEPWRNMRKGLNSSLTAFTAARYMVRPPHLGGTNFHFSEKTDGKEENYVWANGVYALMECIAAACFQNDWPVQWRGEKSGGLMSGMSRHVLAPGHVVGPLDAEMTNSREAVFSQLGFLPLLQLQGTADVLIRGGQTAYEPNSYTGKDGIVATANANLQSCLPYILLICRISHFTTKMAWSKVGDAAMNAVKLEYEINEWLKTDVILSGVDPTTEAKKIYEKPVAKAVATVRDLAAEGKPGCYNVKVKITPHVQFERATFDLSLAAEVGRAKSD